MLIEPVKNTKGESKVISWGLILVLLEESLHEACGSVQSGLDIGFGDRASIYFSDDSQYRRLLLPYIIQECEDSHFNWHSEVATRDGLEEMESVFQEYMVYFSDFGSFFAIIDGSLNVCAANADGTPDLETITGVSDFYPDVVKRVNEHFGTSFKANVD